MQHRLDERLAGRYVQIVLAGIERAYPHVGRVHVTEPGQLRPHREETPAFYGCLDWHSAVHGHWTLVRLVETFPEAPWADEARLALERNLTADNLAAELDFLSQERNRRFELPYGLAWLLQLDAELRAADDPQAARLADVLEPLVTLGRDRLLDWVAELPFPIRSGQHGQSAFAMGLALDWCASVGDDEFTDALRAAAIRFHADEADAPLAYEPSAYDFLSPSLATADLMRRALDADEFGVWLQDFLPGLTDGARTPPLEPVTCPDPGEGKLAHLDGLNLSRAWMLDGIAHVLPDEDPRIPPLLASAGEHGAAGLDAVSGEHYAGAHWLPSFAVYLLTRRGIR